MHEIEDQTKFYNSKAKKTGWRDFIRPDFIKNLLPYGPIALLPQRLAFTMAEILISLTIIGVIAAITLPSLRANINEKTWATQKKALYSRMSQAIAMMPALNGYTSSSAFITEGLSKVLEVKNICNRDKLSNCGTVSNYKDMSGSKKSLPIDNNQLSNRLYGTWTSNQPPYDTYSLANMTIAAFETKNGESIAVFYNPSCRNNLYKMDGSARYVFFAPLMCANFIYDLNGKKGPNQVGKDIGYITVFYPTDSEVVMPTPMHKDSLHENGSYTTSYSSALRTCRLEGSDVRLPNNEELASMAINRNFSGMLKAVGNGSGMYVSATRTSWWKVDMAGLAWTNLGYEGAIRVRCIKR